MTVDAVNRNKRCSQPTDAHHGSGNRWRYVLLCLAGLWIFTIGPQLGQSQTVQGQPVQGQPEKKQGGVFRQFRSGEQKQSMPPVAPAAAEPSQLQVIDRETARRLAQQSPHPLPQPPSNRRHEHHPPTQHQQYLDSSSQKSNMPNQSAPSSEFSERLPSERRSGDDYATRHPREQGDNDRGSDRAGRQPIEQASYQQGGEPRFYQTPAPNPTPYDLPPGYAPGNFQQPGNQAYSSPSFDSRAHTQMPLDHYIQDPLQSRIDETYGAPSAEHPGFNSRYFDSGQTSIDQRGIVRPATLPSAPNPTFYGQEVHSSLFPPHVIEPDLFAGNAESFSNGGQGFGQGYLQIGSALQGIRLRNRPITATEAALELQLENERLREAAARLNGDLTARHQELDHLQATVRRKDDELKLALSRLSELRDQLDGLSQERNLAVQERMALERQFNEQLRGIENMLDGVLWNQLSDK